MFRRPHLTGVACAATFLLAFALPHLTALAAGASEDFNAARLAHEKAAAAAVSTINDAYKATLEKILQNARQASNLDLVGRAQQELNKLTVQRPTLESAGPKAEFVGKWDFLFLDNGVSYVMDFQPDGNWTQPNGGPGGHWTLSDDQIVVNFNAYPGAHDYYSLPAEVGLLHGHNAEGGHMQLSRHGLPIPDDVKAELVGLWRFHIPVEKKPRDVSINSDGSYSEAGKRVGWWTVADNRLYVNFDAHDTWHDIYELPVADNELHGRNPFRSDITLTRSDTL